MFQKISEGDVFFTTEENRAVIGPRMAVLPDGRIACTFHSQTKVGSNDFAPMIAYSDDGVTWSGAKYLWPELLGKESVFGSIRNTLDGRVCFGGSCTPITKEGEFNEWTDFAFGEPHVVKLPDGTLLACLWYDQNGKKGIRYVRLKITE